MLFGKKSAANKRSDFRRALKGGKLLRFPGSFAPYVSLMIERQGFDGVYISGAVTANDLALPDIGMTTLTEVAQRARQIARATDLPALVDIDTGFGEPMNAARTVQELEELGLAGCHLEDQQNPKRCGHLDNKQIVETSEMVKKVRAAASARRDSNFVLIARTDARALEGFDKAVERAKAYVGAGADMIFPEALQDEKEFEKFRQSIDVPMMANMTEFGKSKLLNSKQLENLGYNLVIYPVTGFRLAMKALEDGFASLHSEGTQEHLLDKMQTRKRLYEILQYEEYNAFDKGVYNFKL